MHYYIKLTATLFLLSVTAVNAFNEESIFEDEDIYRKALPPVTQTGITVPGTKWCGPGNTSAHYNDLGSQWEADTCCRAHDNCPEIMDPQTSLRGLTNTDWFPVLNCMCEQEFINCLQRVNNVVSNTLGRVYFSSRSKCFAEGHPAFNCKVYQEGTFRKRCILYNVDETKQREWQFYDMPYYTNAITSVGSLLRQIKAQVLR